MESRDNICIIEHHLIDRNHTCMYLAKFHLSNAYVLRDRPPPSLFYCFIGDPCLNLPELLVVISRTWTSLVGVLKLPRVSNTFKDYTRLHIAKPLNEELKLQILYYVVQTSNSSHCKFSACQRLYRWFWKFFNVFSENPFLSCLPHRSRLFRLNSPDIMKFSSWKSLKM